MTTATTDPIRQFREAIQRRDAAAVRSVLSQHEEARAAVNEPIFSFDSPALAHVAGSGGEDLVRALLEFGADPNRRTSWWAGGFHPLHGAGPAESALLLAAGAVPDACAAAHLDRPDLLRDIIEADPAAVHQRGGDGQTPLHFARSRAVVDLLLEHGADIDARDIDHRATPAQWMLGSRKGAGRYDLARYLVERGATADIFLAAALGLTERLRALVAADPSLLDLQTTRGEYGEKPPSSFHIYMWTIGPNMSPVQVAAQFEQDEAVDVLLDGASPRQRFLAACMRGRTEEARAILREQPSILDSLTRDDRRALPDAGWTGNAAAVETMLALGFDPAAQGHDGGTVLHCAAWQGSADAVRAILGYAAGRALIGTPDPTYGSTPLGWCCNGAEFCGDPRADHVAVARLLFAAGADPGPLQNAPQRIRAILEQRTGQGQGHV
jgi:ankyrin repeat protein